MKKLVQIISITLFMLLISLSLILKASAKFLGWPDFTKMTIEENRQLAKKPNYRTLSIGDWGKETDIWYNDNFAYRAKLLSLYKYFSFNILKSAIGEQIPGAGNWIFRIKGKHGNWPEIEDYLGAIVIDDNLISEWRTLIEGRTMWAKAHGAIYLEVITPMKARVHPELLPSVIRLHPGISQAEQLAKAMESSFAKDNTLFLTQAFILEAQKGHILFYEEDHHENAYGCHLIYSLIDERLRKLGIENAYPVPYYEEVPETVLNGTEMGCYTPTNNHRLEVVYPGSHLTLNPALGIHEYKKPFSSARINIEQPGEGASIIMAHDSFMRFSLTSWHQQPQLKMAVPFGKAFSQITMFIFHRFSTDMLENVIPTKVPTVLIEQFPEGKIVQGLSSPLDEVTIRAAEYGRLKDVDYSKEGDYSVLAVLKDVKASGTVSLITATGEILATENIKPGATRAIFFGKHHLLGDPVSITSTVPFTLFSLNFRQ